VVFSCEGSRVESDQLSLTTAGIGAVVLNVKGRASHAGDAPERGRNALYELAHQILQTRDLSNPEIGLKMNRTIANAGTVRNAIPASASATADVRVLRVADYDGIERKVRERIKKQLIPDTTVDMTFERDPPARSDDGFARTRQARAGHLRGDRQPAAAPMRRSRRCEPKRR
jgi:glutamate carboxypeptidase